MPEVTRHSDGRFKKGTAAPNPGGRPHSKEIVAYIREISNGLQDYVDILDSIVKDKKNRNADRISCIRELLDRSMGKAIQSIHQTGDLDIKIGLPKDLEEE